MRKSYTTSRYFSVITPSSTAIPCHPSEPMSWQLSVIGVAMICAVSTVQSQSYDPVFELTRLSGENGFKISSYDTILFESIAAAGDINADGIDDVIMHGNNGNRSNRVFVVFGSVQPFPSEFDPTTVNGTNGFLIDGEDQEESDCFGSSVSAAGDINGDGIDDLIIGAPCHDRNRGDGTGKAYVIFGSSEQFQRRIDLSNLNGSNGFSITGERIFSAFGLSVSGAGDINSDGFDDVIIGSLGSRANVMDRADAGSSYIIFGTDQGFDATINPLSLDGTAGFLMVGAPEQTFAGEKVAGAGDVNGDGIDDLLITATCARQFGFSPAGVVYVVFGTTTGFGAVFDLGSLNGTNGFTIKGDLVLDPLRGADVSGTDDVNGDGISDLIIGSPRAGIVADRAGRSYVVFGSDQAIESELELTALNGTNGFTVNGLVTGELSGGSVSGAGDINSDGLNDVVIGAPGGGLREGGASYVIFGSTDPYDAEFDLSSLNGISGFAIYGPELRRSGKTVSRAGDINADGIADLIISSTGFGRDNYVVFGRRSDPRFDDECNLLPNGSLNVTTAGWFSNTAPEIVSDSVAGTGALRFAAGSVSTSVPVLPGIHYRVTGYSKSSQGSDWAGLGIDFLDKSRQEISELVQALNPTENYQKFILDGITPTDTQFIQIWSYAGDSRSIQLDELNVQRADCISGESENEVPMVVRPGDQSDTVGSVVNLQILATDPEHDTLSYSAFNLPKGLQIDSTSGLISGTVVQVTHSIVLVTVSDGELEIDVRMDWFVVP